MEHVARRLLGKYLFTRLPLDPPERPCVDAANDETTVLTGGIIVETEAYAGTTDRASHAYGGRFTPRTATLYQAGGVAYVYLCYGLHALFNVVTSVEGIPHAVLIRAIEPTHGLDAMRARRGVRRTGAALTAGPGRLTQALGITTACDGADLRAARVWIERRRPDLAPRHIRRSPRIGVAYAGDDAARPYRFRIRHNSWTSRVEA